MWPRIGLWMTLCLPLALALFVAWRLGKGATRSHGQSRRTHRVHSLATGSTRTPPRWHASSLVALGICIALAGGYVTYRLDSPGAAWVEVGMYLLVPCFSTRSALRVHAKTGHYGRALWTMAMPVALYAIASVVCFLAMVGLLSSMGWRG